MIEEGEDEDANNNKHEMDKQLEVIITSNIIVIMINTYCYIMQEQSVVNKMLKITRVCIQYIHTHIYCNSST